MKKSLASVAAAVALVGGFGMWSTWVAAQPPASQPVRPVSASSTPAPAATTAPAAASQPGTRVAVVNINKVLKSYQKAQTLNNAIKTKVQAYAKQMNDKREEIQKLQAELTKPTVPQADKERMEKQIVSLQRYLQDMDNEARKTIGKEQGDIAVQLFREIEGVIRAVATTYNFDIVLSYPDATDDNEMYVQDNIVRKLAAQAAMPLFYKPHVDITAAVIGTLNASYPAPAGSPAPVPGK